ncbi:hypothetical protein HDU98_010853 [Podochytrium sp. JEL0797]|nr:hypothetical protein HDU98_010853 [Podochytrium sp. JEL0797]
MLLPRILLPFAPAAAPSGSDPFADLAVSLRPQPSVFDICMLCNSTTPAASCNLPLAAQQCNSASTQRVGTIHSLVGNYIQIHFNYDSWADRKLQFFLQSPANSNFTMPLSDFRNPSAPATGAFFPQDKGHNPASFTMQVPNVSLLNQYAITYRYFLEGSTTVYNQSTLKFLVLDKDTSSWILPSQLPSSTPSNSPSPNDNSGSSGSITSAIWTAIIVSMVLLALIMSVVGFVVGRYAKRRREADRVANMAYMADPERTGSGDRNGTAGFLVANTPPPDSQKQNMVSTRRTSTLSSRRDVFQDSDPIAAFIPSQQYPSEAADGYHSDDEVLVFRKSGDTRSVASKASAGSSSNASSSGGSGGPKSILKKREEVEREALEAQIYDPTVMKGFRHLQQQAGYPVVSAAAGNSKKMVSFKECIDMASVDLSAPAAAMHSVPLPGEMSCDSREDDLTSEEGGSERVRALDFRDGGAVEKDMSNLLGVLDDEEGEYDSDVSEGWRKE